MRGRSEDGTDFIGLSTSWRYMPEKGDHGKIAATLTYALTDRITLGVDYRPLSDDLTGIGSIRLLDETGTRPAVVLGTSADEFESVLSQSYHLILSKKVFDQSGLSIAPYVGPIYIAELDKWNVVGGVTARKDKVSLMGMWSGTDTHIVAKYDLTERLSAGVVWWGLKTLGMTASYRF